jgi:hypothetical protein
LCPDQVQQQDQPALLPLLLVVVVVVLPASLLPSRLLGLVLLLRLPSGVRQKQVGRRHYYLGHCHYHYHCCYCWRLLLMTAAGAALQVVPYRCWALTHHLMEFAPLSLLLLLRMGVGTAGLELYGLGCSFRRGPALTGLGLGDWGRFLPRQQQCLQDLLAGSLLRPHHQKRLPPDHQSHHHHHHCRHHYCWNHYPWRRLILLAAGCHLTLSWPDGPPLLPEKQRFLQHPSIVTFKSCVQKEAKMHNGVSGEWFMVPSGEIKRCCLVAYCFACWGVIRVLSDTGDGLCVSIVPPR